MTGMLERGMSWPVMPSLGGSVACKFRARPALMAAWSVGQVKSRSGVARVTGMEGLDPTRL